MAVLLLTNLASFRSKCEVVTLWTWPLTKRKDCLRSTDHVPTGSVTQRSMKLAYNGLHLPHSRTNTATSRKAEHEQRVKARVKSTWLRAARAGQLFIAFLPNYGARPEWASLSLPFCAICPPLWCAARPRSRRSIGGPVIICLLFHLPTFMARGPSGPACNCLSAQFSPVMARGPSRPAYRLPFCSICPRFGARLERVSLSMPCCSL